MNKTRQTLLTAFCFFLVAFVATAQAQTPPPQTQQEFKTYVQKIVHTNLSHPDFNLNTILPITGMKRSLFYKQFNLVFACTPNQFLRHERLKMAAHLLQDDSLSISDIAFQVGFTNHAYFTKCFREYYGVPPSAYKNQVQETSTNHNL